MKLYSGSAEEFILDNDRDNILDKLKLNFFYKYRYEPSEYELYSWKNSLKELSNIFRNSGLKNSGVILEYKLPLTTKRLSCIVTGKNKNSNEAVIIELKEWFKTHKTSGKNEVATTIAGKEKVILHPSVQTMKYTQYLQETLKSNQPININSCTYLYNYNFEEDDAVKDNKFKEVLLNYPVFSKDDSSKLERYITNKIGDGQGIAIIKDIEKSTINPDKKLMNHISNVIKGIPEYILIDEQQIVYDKIYAEVKDSCINKEHIGKKVIIIKGGPGTGKSVIAINLMADLLKEGYETNYATGSRAFTETLRSVIGSKGTKAFKYFNSYMKVEENQLDVLICDEAHRIRKSSNNRFTKKEDKSDLEQIEELFKAAKVCVFFIDDAQRVRPDEIGKTSYIKSKALDKGYDVHEYELKAQFRCRGSENFVSWLDNTLGIEKTPNIIYDTSKDEFEFQIVNSPFELEEKIMKKAKEGYSSRMVAGFCWPWSKVPDENGDLINDIIIGDFKKPWNAHPDIRNLKENIPKAPKWAIDSNGINQVGCIYTAQGFEFDYIGVIVGKDLIYNLDESKWEGNKDACYDVMVKKEKENFTDLIKNTYRVLISRGMKGCYVWFEDEGAEEFFRSRIE